MAIVSILNDNKLSGKAMLLALFIRALLLLMARECVSDCGCDVLMVEMLIVPLC